MGLHLKPIRLIASLFTVGIWTLLSRVLGFVRDILITAFLGAGPVAEAFLIAFALPNMFRRFFAEGAFNMAFVPLFSKKLESDDNPHGFAQDAFAGLATILIVFTAVALLAMPWLVTAMAGGFIGDARFDLATLYGRIAFPYIFFISLAALLSGVLNATGRFAAAAAAPSLLNILFIATLSAAYLQGWPIGDTLAWTVPIGGVAQFALVWWAARKAGFALTFSLPKLSPDLKKLAIIAAPAALAGGVVQVNLLIGRQVASFFEGAIVWVSVADRLYQLPLGVVGIAVGVVLLPDLSRRLRAGDDKGGRDAFNRATEISIALTLPAAIALIVIPIPLISVLFERGAFTSTDTSATALALAIYGVGLPAFVLQKVLQPLYFAREDTRTPLRFALYSMIVNAVVAIGLSPILGFLAAPLGTTLAAWAMTYFLWRGTSAMGETAKFDNRLLTRLPKIVLSSVAMGAVLLVSAVAMQNALETDTIRYFALIALTGIGIVTYFAAAHFTNALRLKEIRNTVKRQSTKPD